MRKGMRLFGGLLTAIAMVASQAQTVQAQALNMSGNWVMEVTSTNGVANPKLMLMQNGTALTGHYASETLGEHDVTGTVAGRNVTVNFTATIEGLGEAPLSYSGAVSAEGVWSGDLVAEVQGQSLAIGTFTATKAGE